jgi:hypothetical protein
MDSTHLPQTCKWATATLFLDWPLWLDASSWDWSCRRDGAIRPLKISEECRTCSAWELREDACVRHRGATEPSVL